MRTRTADKENSQGESGQRAALFPALSEGSKEKRAVSILLACMEQVPELSKSLLQAQGAPLGKRSRLQAWTEAGPTGKKGADRPDGRIEVETTRGQKWVALLEAKIGKASLDSAQIESYLSEARAAGADALITISNDFAVLANHHPTYRGNGRSRSGCLRQNPHKRSIVILTAPVTAHRSETNVIATRCE